MTSKGMTRDEVLTAIDDLTLDMFYINREIVNAKTEDERQSFLQSYEDAQEGLAILKSML